MRKFLLIALLAAPLALAAAPAEAFIAGPGAVLDAAVALDGRISVKKHKAAKWKKRPPGWDRGGKSWRGGMPPGQRKKYR